MTTPTYQVQSVLKAYRVQLSAKARLGRRLTHSPGLQDHVQISGEGRKKALSEKITQEIFRQVANGAEQPEAIREGIRQLSQEAGKELALQVDERLGLSLQVPAPGGDKSVGTLSASDQTQLKSRLFDITQSIIYNHLV